MQEKTDAQLLRDYAEHRNEAAFRELVTRHADVVYASALRQVSSPDLAHDIAQSVFTDLARKAPTARRQPDRRTPRSLGWLYRSTRFLALKQLRDDRRRQARERQAMENFDPASETAPEWERVQPVLDEAMADLSDEDRDALLLRFFKNHDFRAIGAALGVSDDAAQKRVSRALERLRAEFHSRGVTTTAVALSTVLSTNAVPLAPAGLAATLSTAALVERPCHRCDCHRYQNHRHDHAPKNSHHRRHCRRGRHGDSRSTSDITVARGRPIAPKTTSAVERQIQQLTKERDDATRQLAVLRNDNERLNRNTAEFAKLRGEVARLQRDHISNSQVASQPPATGIGNDTKTQPVGFISKNQLADSAFDTPEAGLQSAAKAFTSGNFDKVLSALAPKH